MNQTKAAAAELIGTFTLTFIGAGAGSQPDNNLLAVALAHGVALMIIIYTWGSVSGAHVNPAVTLGLLVGGKVELGQAIAYWIAQFLGAAAAGFLLLYLLGAESGLGQTLGSLSKDREKIDVAKVILVEAILTFFLVSAVYSSGVAARNGHAVGLAIGFVLVMDILMGGPLTGASMNPARTFGPAIALGELWYLPYYIAGPAIGAVVAGIAQIAFFMKD